MGSPQRKAIRVLQKRGRQRCIDFQCPTGMLIEEVRDPNEEHAVAVFRDRLAAHGLLPETGFRLEVPPFHVKAGEIYVKALVLRMDKSGLFLEIPSPTPSPGFVSMHGALDKDVKNVEKKFREDRMACVHVLGVRNLEEVAIGTLKKSAYEGSVLTHADVKPGTVVRAKVVTVEPFGAIIQFSSGVKAVRTCKIAEEV